MIKEMKAMDKHHFQVFLLLEAPPCKILSQQIIKGRMRKNIIVIIILIKINRVLLHLRTYKILDKVKGREDDGKDTDHVSVLLCSLLSSSIMFLLPT